MARLRDLIVDESSLPDLDSAVSVPPLGIIVQRWDTDPISEGRITTAAANAVARLPLSGVPDGGDVAVGVGSRGIANLPAIVSGVIEGLRDQGLEPFVVPAMGSHGGATAEGQREMLGTLGVTESSVDCEIRASMDVTEVGRTPDRDVPVVTDAHAAEADAIVPVNRVKPHTDYDGDIESGLAKMLVIGFGKQRGANIAHDWAIDWSLREMVPSIARQLLDTLPIVGGIAILEDQRDQTARIEGVPAASLLERERDLLSEAEALLPRLPFDDLDVLVVDRQGKDVSGQGIDPNVIGRRAFAINEPAPDSPEIKRIYVRSLTARTHGNAMGMGSADFVHRNVFEEVDPDVTFINALTASTIRGVRLPPVMENDRAALMAALSSIGVRSREHVRLLRITDTMRVERMYASPSLVEAAKERPELEVIGSPEPVTFDDRGDLVGPSADPP